MRKPIHVVVDYKGRSIHSFPNAVKAGEAAAQLRNRGITMTSAVIYREESTSKP